MNEFATRMISDIRHHPERHRHTFKELLACCMDPAHDALDLEAMDAHGKYAPIKVNETKDNCDVTEGPCACDDVHK